ncbi:hypothetical protein ES703_97381 [subsurface metagenome]
MLVAVVMSPSYWSKILAVTSEVLVPSALMLAGEAVLAILVGTGISVVFTFTVP